MDSDTALQQAKTILASWTKETQTPEAHRLDAIINALDLLMAVKALRDAGWGYLSAITGVDLGGDVGELEVLYHFCEGRAIATLRVRLPRDVAHIDSVCEVIPSAGFFERELSEMLGVEVMDTPNAARLFLPDDWPAGVYPLRKDAPLKEITA